MGSLEEFMRFKIYQLCSHLEQRIYKLVRDDGVLDSADHETKIYKLSTLVSLAQDILKEEGEHRAYIEKVVKQLNEIVALFELGEPDFKTEENIRLLLRNMRSGIKGLQTELSLADLDADDELPEYLDEANEPFIDPQTGECHYPTDLEFSNQIVWSFNTNRDRFKESAAYLDAMEALTTKMQKASLKVKAEFETDLGDGLTGVANPRIAIKASLQEMLKATKRYFEPTHLATTEEVARVSQAFYEKQNVQTDLCAGSLIVAACEALRSVHLLKDELVQHEAKLSWQAVDLSLQRRPAATNIGNLFIRNVGCYGHRKEGEKSKLNILDDFDNISAYSGEDRLKDVIAKYGANPNRITCKMLNLPNNAQGQKLLKKFKNDLFLIFCAEIFRYFPVEESVTRDVKKVPFSVALSMGLEMLCSGEVELDELFDHDASLGLPTGIGILNNDKAIFAKFENLIQRYQRYLENAYSGVEQFKKVFPQGIVVCDSAHHVEGLQTHFGRHLKKRSIR